MSAELKACPFCGGEATWVSGGPGCAYVKCNGCPAETGDGSVPRISDAWNRRTDLSQAAVAAALEAAAKQVGDHGEWMQSHNLIGNGYDFAGQAKAIRALITPSQHDALAAHVAAEVAKARVEDAAKIAQLEQDLADANSGAGDAYRRGYWEGGNGA